MNDRVNDQTGGPLKPVPVPSTSPSLQSGEPQRAGTSQVLIHKQTVVTSSGPLPQAAELAAYNQAVPDGAQRIVAMAEKQAGHRMSIEAQVIKLKSVRVIWARFSLWPSPWPPFPPRHTSRSAERTPSRRP